MNCSSLPMNLEITGKPTGQGFVEARLTEKGILVATDGHDTDRVSVFIQNRRARHSAFNTGYSFANFQARPVVYDPAGGPFVFEREYEAGEILPRCSGNAESKPVFDKFIPRHGIIVKFLAVRANKDGGVGYWISEHTLRRYARHPIERPHPVNGQFFFQFTERMRRRHELQAMGCRNNELPRKFVARSLHKKSPSITDGDDTLPRRF